MFDIAVLGAGRIGKVHAHNAAAHPALRLKYVFDPRTDAALDLAARTGAAAARDLDQVLKDPGVAGVIVASSTDCHLDQCVRAIAAGKTVLCEKPLDMDLNRARSQRDRLGGGVRLMLGFNRRFDPSFAALRDRLATGAVGALETLHIVSHDPAPPPISYIRVSGGLFKDMAIHDFDMARWLLGEEPVEVFAAASCLVDPAIGAAGDVDTAKTLLRTATGKICMISNSRRSGYGYDQRIEAFGSRGQLRADNILENSVSAWSETGMASGALQNFFLDRYAEAYRREVAQFAKLLGGEAAPAAGYADGVAALALAEAAEHSARSGKVVAL
ncbi:MAG TPA: inositol 2-dehydrogenase [Steroidobacteraceae bacterium]|nr:inositol 2-dehydrogenase [Steroidobacteraceae bacterium]